jgi:hypothetical protein
VIIIPGKYDPRSLKLASQTWQEKFAMKGIFEEMAKIKPETTRHLKDIFGSIERMSRSNMLAPIRNSLMMPARQLSNQIGFGVQSALMPMTIQLNSMVNKVNMGLQQIVESNRKGAAVGGMVGGGIGFIAGFVLPGGPVLWGMVGSVAGSVLGGASGAQPMEDTLRDSPDWVQDMVWDAAQVGDLGSMGGGVWGDDTPIRNRNNRGLTTPASTIPDHIRNRRHTNRRF